MNYAEKQPIRYTKALSYKRQPAILWALATPLVLWLSRRFRIERSNWMTKSRTPLLYLASCFASAANRPSFHSLHGGHGPRAQHYAHSEFSITSTTISIAGYSSTGLILVLSHAFNYYHSFRKGELKASQLHTQLVQSQLEALKMQVQPHFLFNTLHSISALLSKDTDGARKMITRLGDFLRLTLENSGSMEVTLQQEIEFLHGYLEIERIRFQDRLTTDIQVDPEVLDVRVPNLILQPIVENAMRHAIGNSTSGRVEITAVPRNGVVRIEVKDNGPGIQVDRTLEAPRGRGLGLANTRARLAGLYGDAASFELSNDPAGGLVVSARNSTRRGRLDLQSTCILSTFSFSVNSLHHTRVISTKLGI